MCGGIMSDKQLEQELKKLKESGDAPKWMTQKGYTTISKGYRLKGESPKGMYRRVANSSAKHLFMDNPDEIMGKSQEEWSQRFFEVMWTNQLCPASPVLSNMGTNRGLPISCFGVHPSDSVYSLLDKNTEMAMLTKNGGGVGVMFNDIRSSGSLIKAGANGKSDGIMAFAPIYDKTINGVSQGSTRRGAASLNLDIEHEDFDEYIRMRRPEGDVNRQCMNLHHAVQISNQFMDSLISGDKKARRKWSQLLISRYETGEPYIMFKDRVNDLNPEAYVKNNLTVTGTNICSEIFLHTDEDHSFICCLSSLNLTKFESWDEDLVEVSIVFLNGVLNEFIKRAENEPGMECTVRHAKKGRAIGLGALGWHTLLQENKLPFDSFDSMTLNSRIFSKISRESKAASIELAKEFGEPEWCKGTGTYNTHLTAIAPTRSNSIISGGLSAGIEPIIRNAYTDKTAKGTFVEKNPTLQRLLKSINKDTEKVWESITENDGSVQHLTFLTDDQREIFKTAFEINQAAIIRQVSQRTPMIDQGQSTNLFFTSNTDPKYYNDVHLLAYELGLKTLYYVRSESKLKTGSGKRAQTIEDCDSCEG